MSLFFATLHVATVVFSWIYLLYWRRCALKAEARIDYLLTLIQAEAIVSAMLRGEKPIVTVAPDGLTLREAQMVIDNIYASLHGQRPN